MSSRTGTTMMWSGPRNASFGVGGIRRLFLAQRGSVGRLDGERRGNERGVLLARDVMEVFHRRLDVGVAHPLLHAADVGLTDHARAEGVAQVVEAERAQAGPL